MVAGRGGGGCKIQKKDDKDWTFQTYMGTNLAYDMLCEPSSSDNEEKDGDYLSSNRLINMKLLATNKYIYFFVSQQCANGKAVNMKLEEERDQEKFIYYVEAYYDPTTTN